VHIYTCQPFNILHGNHLARTLLRKGTLFAIGSLLNVYVTVRVGKFVSTSQITGFICKV